MRRSAVVVLTWHVAASTFIQVRAVLRNAVVHEETTGEGREQRKINFVVTAASGYGLATKLTFHTAFLYPTTSKAVVPGAHPPLLSRAKNTTRTRNSEKTLECADHRMPMAKEAPMKRKRRGIAFPPNTARTLRSTKNRKRKS